MADNIVEAAAEFHVQINGVAAVFPPAWPDASGIHPPRQNFPFNLLNAPVRDTQATMPGVGSVAIQCLSVP
jgi:hypothetical protein